MSDKPVTHGPDHRPGGFDPTPTGPWHFVASSGLAWNSGLSYQAGDQASHDVFIYVCIVPNTNKEPGVNAKWANYWQIDVPLFQNGWGNSGGSYAVMRYKLAVGPPHILDKDDGSVISYLDHQIEIQGSVTGGSSATTIFTLPPAYAPDSDLHLSACDDSGAFVCFTVQTAGDVIDGFV